MTTSELLVMVDGKRVDAKIRMQPTRVPRWGWLPRWTRHLPLLGITESVALVDLAQAPPAGAQVTVTYCVEGHNEPDEHK